MLCSVSDLRLQAILLYSISSHSANCVGSPHRFQERTEARCKAECCGPKTTCWVITSSVLFYLVPLFTTRKRERGKLQITIPDIHTLSYTYNTENRFKYNTACIWLYHLHPDSNSYPSINEKKILAAFEFTYLDPGMTTKNTFKNL